MRVIIFEDDKELADALKDRMDTRGFEVENIYNMKQFDWRKAEVVLADYRNELVPFEQVRQICFEHGVPLLAISGRETGFRPQLIKPFSIDDLQVAMLDAMKANSIRKREIEKAGGGSLIGSLKKLFGAK
jgi:DNA-binding response OmpR family regulator